MNNVDLLWKEIMERLDVKISVPSIEAWISKLEPLTIKDNAIILLAKNSSVKRIVETKFMKQIMQSAAEVRCPYGDIIIITDEEKNKYIEPEKTDNFIVGNKTDVNKGFLSNQFNNNYTFDNFVVGNSNEFVAAAAKAVAENPGHAYNPLFIYGGVGLGKTHIMHAIGSYIQEHNPSYKVHYITAENFTNELIFAIRNNSGADLVRNFREKYRSLDVLIIDDIQFIAKKDSTQEALFHIFNELYNQNKQIVLSSDRPLSETTDIEERLTSRFAWGLIADIQPPSFETRIAILQKKAFQHHFNLEMDVLRYIAEKNSTNIRMLEGMLQNVVFYIQLNDRKGNQLQLAKEALKDYETESEEKITIDNIIESVCSYFKITKEMMVGKKKNKEVVEPRQIAMYLITDMLPLIPLTTIGQYFSGRDHSTVIHARDKVTNLINTVAKTKATIVDIRNLILKK